MSALSWKLRRDLWHARGQAVAVAVVVACAVAASVSATATQRALLEQPKFKKGRYVLEMSLIMAGPWIIILKITAGEKTTTAKFNFDAH